MDTHTDDAALARAASCGDRESLAALVERVRLRLFAAAYDEAGHYEDAQDAVAAAVVRICRAAGGLRAPDRAAAWMAAIARNEARRIIRARRLYVPLDERLPAPEQDTVLRLDVERALRALPADQGRAAALFYLAGVPIREIAARLGRPEGTVKYWLHEGRRRLAEHMEGYGTMAEQWQAAIVTEEPQAPRVSEWASALRAGGWDTCKIVGRAEAAAVQQTGDGDEREWHVSPALAGCRLILVEDPLGPRSAFELLTLLNATVERKEMGLCLLVEPPADPGDRSAALAAWLLGALVFLHKPVDPAELARYAHRIREMQVG